MSKKISWDQSGLTEDDFSDKAEFEFYRDKVQAAEKLELQTGDTRNIVSKAIDALLDVFMKLMEMILKIIMKPFDVVVDLASKFAGRKNNGKSTENMNEVEANQNINTNSGQDHTDALNFDAVSHENQGVDKNAVDLSKIDTPEEQKDVVNQDVKGFDYKAGQRHGISQARDILKELESKEYVEIAEGFYLQSKENLTEQQKNWDLNDSVKNIDFSQADFWIVSNDRQIGINSAAELKHFLINKDKILSAFDEKDFERDLEKDFDVEHNFNDDVKNLKKSVVNKDVDLALKDFDVDYEKQKHMMRGVNVESLKKARETER